MGAMMAIGFSVRGNIRELRPLPRVGESCHEALRKILAAHEDIFKGHRVRDRSVKEKQNHAASGGQIGQISTRGVDLASADVFPFFLPYMPHSLGGMLRKH